ncbi:hypothetical protein BDV96DRAFT_683388 [Lophiotrema nucula]|uniref:SnoaL-like domain-containing protein n=1 Tax=Lophiotrema nucula TaxID=690887 RepID=A0A6A5ZRW6_9PLEO|nr:hypothetical protein BDV96DRAFT_683388 [Lophiotrema nucula]
MSYPTQAVFIAEGDKVRTWSPEIRKHPAIDWMHHFTTKVFDGRGWDVPATKYALPDFILKKSDGTVVKGAEEGWEADKALYAPFTAHKHEPNQFMMAETNDGWMMSAGADLFVNIHGQPDEGEKKVKDFEGKEWDAVVSAMFRFVYVKVDDEDAYQGIKLRSIEIFSDPLPALGLMLKRGVVKPEQLLG